MVIKEGKITHSFVAGYTSGGYVSFINNFLAGDKVYGLRGATLQVKSRIMRDLANNLLDRGFDVNLIHNGINPDILDGVRISPLKITIIDSNNLPQFAEDDIVDLTHLIDVTKLDLATKKELSHLENKKKKLLEQASIRQGATLTIIPGAKHMLGEAVTCKGKVSYYSNLLESVNNKFYLNNLDIIAASQILTFFAQVMARGKMAIEVYHNFFHSHIIELVIVKELNLAIGVKRFSESFNPINCKNVLYVENIPVSAQELEKIADILVQVNLLIDKIEELYIEATNFSKITYIEDIILADIVKNMLKKPSF